MHLHSLESEQPDFSAEPVQVTRTQLSHRKLEVYESDLVKKTSGTTQEFLSFTMALSGDVLPFASVENI